MTPTEAGPRGATSSRTRRPSFRDGSGESAILPAEFFARPAAELARDLLGRRLVSVVGDRKVAGRIIETEAYIGPGDPACHAAERIGRTRRNAAMFGPPGTAYLYFIYGMHWCLNAVASTVGDPQAVLIRALEPLEGKRVMAGRRGRSHDLANGPARVCQALGIDGSLDAHALDGAPLWIERGRPLPDELVRATGRIGIREARDWPLRFLQLGNAHVSPGRPRPSGRS